MPRFATLALLLALILVAGSSVVQRAHGAPPDAVRPAAHDVPPALAQEDTPKLYDDTLLRDIEFTFEDSDWRQQLERMDAANPHDLPASLTVDGETLEQVGVRYKGNTSQRVNSVKKPFNVKTHAFVDGQDLWGYDVINLNNAASDPSILREAVGYRILRDYMPVPQTAYARVSAQGDYLGVYLMVEQVNREMVDAWFPSDGGIIIKGDPATGARLNESALQWRGESVSEYEKHYEVKTEGSEQAGYEHLRELSRALAAPVSQGGLSDADFADGIREVLDVEAALWYLAGSNLIQNGDSYYAGHNYYLYETAREPRFNLLSWDLNMSFGVFPLTGMGGPGGPGVPGRPPPGGETDLAKASPFTAEDSQSRPLIRRLLRVPDYRADYIAHLRTLRDDAFAPGRVEAIAVAYHDLIQDAVRDEPDPIFDLDLFDENMREDVSAPGMRGRSVTVPGVLSLAAARYEYLRDHPDLQGPDVVLADHVFEPPAPTAADTVHVSATFSGADAARRAELRYRVDGGAERIVEMTVVDASTWRADVPAQRAGREVSYVIRAGLEDGRAAFFPPATLTQPFAYEVAGVELPLEQTGDLVLNELMAANDTTIADEVGEFDDWIELYNRGSQPIDLAGYFLSDDPTDPWAFPLPDAQLGPGEHVLVWCDNDTEQGPFHAPFALARDGESAVLSTDEAIVDQVEFGELDADVSFARERDGDEPWVTCHTPSPNAENRCGEAPPTPTPPEDTPTVPPAAGPTETPTEPPSPDWLIHLPIASRT